MKKHKPVLDENLPLTAEEIRYVVDNKLTGEANPSQTKQIMAFMFGDEFIASDDKGTLKEY
jgi:hypothetical protein